MKDVKCSHVIEFDLEGETVTGHIEHVLHSGGGVEVWYKRRLESTILSPKFIRFSDIKNVIRNEKSPNIDEFLPFCKDGLKQSN